MSPDPSRWARRFFHGQAPDQACAVYAPSGEVPAPWTVADRYKLTKQSMVIVAGEREGMGSYRDWAALEAAVEIAKKTGAEGTCSQTSRRDQGSGQSVSGRIGRAVLKDEPGLFSPPFRPISNDVSRSASQ